MKRPCPKNQVESHGCPWYIFTVQCSVALTESGVTQQHAFYFMTDERHLPRFRVEYVKGPTMTKTMCARKENVRINLMSAFLASDPFSKIH